MEHIIEFHSDVMDTEISDDDNIKKNNMIELEGKVKNAILKWI
jgi:hypothetical protein